MVIDNFKNVKLFESTKIKNLSSWHQDKGYTRELEVFIDAVKNGKPSPFTLQEINDVHLTIFKVAESLKNKKVIEFEN